MIGGRANESQRWSRKLQLSLALKLMRNSTKDDKALFALSALLGSDDAENPGCETQPSQPQ